MLLAEISTIMDYASYISVAILVVFVINQTRWTIVTLKTFAKAKKRVIPEPNQLPKAAVIVCLRGCDPSLKACMEGLLSQDYPNFKLFAVIDSENDPAAPVMRELAEQHLGEKLELQYLTERLKTCSLKNSSQLQVLRHLDESYQAVVFVDSDADTPDDFLKRLIAPLVTDGADVSTGVRWFRRNTPGLASLCRYFWNMVTSTVMGYFRMPWGGAMAVSREFLDRAKLIEVMERCICEDVPIGQQIHKHGAQLEMANIVRTCDEEVKMSDFIVYGNRQLLYAKLYHHAWPTIFFFTVGTFVAYMILAVTSLIYALQHNTFMLVLTMVGISLYWATLHFVQEFLNKEFGDGEKKSLKTHLNWLKASVYTQHLQTWFTVSALFRKLIIWRGVSYRIDGPYDLEMLDDAPLEDNQQSKPEHSII